MKITIEQAGVRHSLEILDDEISVGEVIQKISNLLRAAGFSFDGELDIVDHSQD